MPIVIEYTSGWWKLDRPKSVFVLTNGRVTNANELLRFTDGRHTFYHVSYNNGYFENFEGKDIYVTRTPIDKSGGSAWDYLQNRFCSHEWKRLVRLQTSVCPPVYPNRLSYIVLHPYYMFIWMIQVNQNDHHNQVFQQQK